jgi:hypothetical protein
MPSPVKTPVKNLRSRLGFTGSMGEWRYLYEDVTYCKSLSTRSEQGGKELLI